MNTALLMSYSAIFIHNNNRVMSSICNDSNHWCYKSGLRIKSSDPGLIQLNKTEYKNCIQYCEENIICKGFECRHVDLHLFHVFL